MGAGASATNCETLPIDRPEAQTFVPILEQSLDAMQKPQGLTPEQRGELRKALEKGSKMYETIISAAPQHQAELNKKKKEKMLDFQKIYAVVYDTKVRKDPNFNTFIERCTEISKQVEGKNIDQTCSNDVRGLIELYEEGAVPLLHEFTIFLQKMAKETGAKQIPEGSLKKLSRALEKIMLEPGPSKGDSSICRDVLRGMIIYEDMCSLTNGLEFIRNHSEWELVRVKNRFDSPTDGGWADCLLNVVKKSDHNCHVAEVQLVHEKLYVARKDLGGHRDYHEYRCANELLANLNANLAQANGGNGTKTDILLADLDKQFHQAKASPGKKDTKLLKQLKSQIESLKDLQTHYGELRAQAKQLQSDLDTAMDRDDFDKVEEIQTKIDTVNNEIKKYESFINLPEKWLEENAMQQNLTAQVNKENTLTQPNTVVKNELCKLTPKQRLDAYEARMKEINQNPVELSLDEAIRRIEKNDHSLLKLNLRFKNIGAEDAKTLAIALEKNSSLLYLSLGWNNIRAEGAKDRAIALEKNSSLLHLDLQSNNIGAEGAKDLAIALEKNSSLLKLDLWENNIGAEGAKNLAIALGKNTSLLELDIRENKIVDEELKEKIKAALKRNKDRKN